MDTITIAVGVGQVAAAGEEGGVVAAVGAVVVAVEVVAGEVHGAVGAVDDELIELVAGEFAFGEEGNGVGSGVVICAGEADGVSSSGSGGSFVGAGEEAVAVGGDGG